MIPTIQICRVLPAALLVLALVPVRSNAITVHESGYAVTQSAYNPTVGMTVDAAGTLYLLDGPSGIRKLSAGGSITPWSTVSAYDFVVSPAGGGFATGGGCKCITAIRADGSQESVHTYTSGWSSLALTPDGSFYGSDLYKGLFRIDPSSLEETPIILGGPGPGGIGYFGGMTAGEDGKLYVTGALGTDISSARLFRLDGSQLVPVATLPHGGGELVAGSGGTFYTRTAFDYGSGYPLSEIWRIDPETGASTLLVTSGSYFHNWNPNFSSFTYDSTTKVLYVQEGGQDTWLIHKIPPSVVTWGEGVILSADTTEVRVQWPVQVKVDFPVSIYLERRTENGTFGSVNDGLNRASDGQVSYADRTVVPGTRYAYRAGAEGASGLEYSGVVWVDVPALTPPPPPVVIWSGGSVTVDTSSVTLAWQINSIITGDVRVERHTSATFFGSVGTLQLAGDGHIQFVDTLVTRGATYVYRAGVSTDSGWVWSDSLTAVVPDVSAPPPPATIWSAGSATADTSTVTLDWPIDPIVTGQVRVERRADDGVFGWIGFVNLTGDGHVHLIDTAVALGARYYYRAGILEESVWSWSGELVADVPLGFTPAPTTYSLAFARGASLNREGSIQVAFTVPAAGTARVDAYDVHGRRVAFSTVETSRSGPYSAQLVSGAPLKPGMYFLRLTLGNATALSRAIMLGSR